jgi:Na+-driven multidrug efflux pump
VHTILLSAHSEQLNAAVSLANQILGVGYDLTTLFSIGVLVLVAQRLGAGDEPGARQIGGLAIRANGAFALVVGLGIALLSPWLVSLVNAPAEIRDDTVLYVASVGASLVFHGLLVAATAVLRGFGHTIEILLLGILANVAYLLLEYGLLFGAFGLPELGVLGAALATIIVRGVGVVLILWVLRRRLAVRAAAPARGAPRRTAEPDPPVRPHHTENVLYNLAQLALVSFVAALGVGAILEHSYALTLGGLVGVIVVALAQGNETLIGWDAGAGDHATARRRALCNAGWTAVATTALAALLWAGSDVLTGLFSAEPAVAEGVAVLLLVGILIQPLQTIATMLFGSLRSVGDVGFPVVVSIGASLLVLPLAAVLVPSTTLWGGVGLGLGVAGLWWALLVAEAIKAIAYVIRWRRAKWASIDLLHEPAAG